MTANKKDNRIIEYAPGYNSDNVYLTTDILLKGRGIKMSGNGSDHKRGKKTYHCTKSAFNKLKEVYKTEKNTKSF